MSEKVCLFAGTTEGRQLAEFLKNAVELTVCVATEYGEIMLDGIDGITVHTGRLNENEMESFFCSGNFGLVIDATHPYARLVSENIASAAQKSHIPVMRILRETDRKVGNAVYVESVEEARDYLAAHEGNVLITTGAKELSSYLGLDMSRVWARVLPVASSLEACEKAGIPVSHIIAVQGPFSEESNVSQLHAAQAKYIVTKESGKSGGFEEKINAAIKTGAIPVIVGKPFQGTGLMLDEAMEELGKRYGISARTIYVIGIGPGDNNLLTKEAAMLLEGCDLVAGAKTVVEATGTRKPVCHEFTPDGIQKYLEEHPAFRRIAVVMRGDTGFYSGAKKLVESFGKENVKLVSGLSSITVFAAKLGIGWDDAALISMHGRGANIIHTVNTNKKTFALTGGANTVGNICSKLCEYGFGDLCVTVGERLTYQDEKLTRETARTLSEREFDPLSVIYIENPEAVCSVRFGISDEEFIRGDVPMTKSEVRAIVLSKLGLTDDAVVWDIGAGTGSVSIECALAASRGQVYAIEKEADGLELIRQNKIKFRADNIQVVSGIAPGVLEDLPAPTHVFIGGSSGNISQIIDAVLVKNPEARIVLTTITLETQAEVTEYAKAAGIDIEAVSVQISRAKKAGKYHMMIAQNPVFVISFVGGKACD